MHIVMMIITELNERCIFDHGRRGKRETKTTHMNHSEETNSEDVKKKGEQDRRDEESKIDDKGQTIEFTCIRERKKKRKKNTSNKNYSSSMKRTEWRGKQHHI